MRSVITALSGLLPASRTGTARIAPFLVAALAAGCGESPGPIRFSEAMARPVRPAADSAPEAAAEALPVYSEGLAPVLRRGRWGYVDTAGRLVVPARFALAGPFREGRAAVLEDSLWGYLDRSGSLCVTPRFRWAGPFREGRAPVSEGAAMGFVDTAGRPIGGLAFSGLRGFSEGLAAVRFGDGEEAAWGFVDREGRLAIPPLFEDVGVGFSGGLAAVASGGKWGYIDTSGGFAIHPRFDAAGDFSGGAALVGSGRMAGGRFRGIWTRIDGSGDPLPRGAASPSPPR